MYYYYDSMAFKIHTSYKWKKIKMNIKQKIHIIIFLSQKGKDNQFKAV
jgi:hypothetical protein